MLRFVGILAVLAAMGGCAAPPATPTLAPVRGVVALDGKPLSKGIVVFRTAKTGALDSLDIVDGKFDGRAVVGERTVEISSFKSTAVSGAMGGEVQENLVADRFNLNTTLTATVSASGPNEYKFDVKSK
jgi:hypothetical protein